MCRGQVYFLYKNQALEGSQVMWSSVLWGRTQILDKFNFQNFLWITLNFKANYAQLYPTELGRIFEPGEIFHQKNPGNLVWLVLSWPERSVTAKNVVWSIATG